MAAQKELQVQQKRDQFPVLVVRLNRTVAQERQKQELILGAAELSLGKKHRLGCGNRSGGK